jgi:hypothetical protein
VPPIILAERVPQTAEVAHRKVVNKAASTARFNHERRKLNTVYEHALNPNYQTRLFEMKHPVGASPKAHSKPGQRPCLQGRVLPHAKGPANRLNFRRYGFADK